MVFFEDITIISEICSIFSALEMYFELEMGVWAAFFNDEP